MSIPHTGLETLTATAIITTRRRFTPVTHDAACVRSIRPAASAPCDATLTPLLFTNHSRDRSSNTDDDDQY